jgi:hypothetical protein
MPHAIGYSSELRTRRFVLLTVSYVACRLVALILTLTRHLAGCSFYADSRMGKWIQILVTEGVLFCPVQRYVETRAVMLRSRMLPKLTIPLSVCQYAANLWVWSTPRAGYPGNPKNPKYKAAATAEEVPPGRVTAIFTNGGKDPKFAHAKLYFHDGTKDSLWGPLGHGDEPYSIHTYKGHVWKLKVDDEVLRTWTIESELPVNQLFSF